MRSKSTTARAGSARQDYTLVVDTSPANANPFITSTPPLAATAGNAYQYQVVASDPESETLSYELMQSPAGMQLDAATGLIQWTPTPDQKGLRMVLVAVRDPQSGQATAELRRLCLRNECRARHQLNASAGRRRGRHLPL